MRIHEFEENKDKMPNAPVKREFQPVKIAVLTVSDTRTPDDDKSGNILVERLTSAGHTLAGREIVTDDIPKIQAVVKRWIEDDGVDVVISTGGTGLTGRDITPEAFVELYDKEIDGWSTIFHQMSFQKIGVSTIQSRTTAGVAGSTYLFALPGSPGACKDGWDNILVHQLDYRSGPCNFVEIMPRLDEHLQRSKT